MAKNVSTYLTFGPDVYFYVFYQIFKIDQIMAEKLSFSVFFASPNRSHFLTKKMFKNASNELKFRPDMYFYRFYQILEDLCKVFKIDQFMAKKRVFRVTKS